MSYTLGEAAKAVGKSKTTLHRAVKCGKISVHRREDGSYSIEPSELHRVFPLVTPVALLEQLHQNDAEQDGASLEALRIQLKVLEVERARERALMQNAIADLREDRDRWRQQATALLEDKRPKGFFRKLLGR